MAAVAVEESILVVDRCLFLLIDLPRMQSST